jgi:hypothetical protein
MNTKELQQHPYGALFPHMPEEDFKALCADIKTSGFSELHPIVLHDGMVLDGWHRNLACIATGITPTYVEFRAPDMANTPLEFVIQENLHRRHLDVGQRCIVGAKYLELTLELEVKTEGVRNSGPSEKKPSQQKIDTAAEVLNVSRDSVIKAAALIKQDPEGAQEVLEGKKSLHAAKTAADAKSEAHGAAVRRIEAVLGDSWTKTVKLTNRELVKMSGLIPEEMERVKAFIESGWKLDAALGHTSTTLTPAHSFRDGFLRAMEKGNKHVAIMEAEKMEWTITIEGKPITPKTTKQ